MQSGRGTNAHSLWGFLPALSGTVRAGQQQGWTRQPVKKEKSGHLEQNFTLYGFAPLPSLPFLITDLIMAFVFLLAPVVKEVCLSLLPL